MRVNPGGSMKSLMTRGAMFSFNQTADTFIRDAAFTAGRNGLTGEDTFGDVTIRLVLVKAT